MSEDTKDYLKIGVTVVTIILIFVTILWFGMGPAIERDKRQQSQQYDEYVVSCNDFCESHHMTAIAVATDRSTCMCTPVSACDR